MIQTKYKYLGITEKKDIIFRISEGKLNEVEVVCSDLKVTEEGLHYQVGVLSIPDHVRYVEDDLLLGNKYLFLERIQFILSDILEKVQESINGNRSGH